MDNTDLNIVFHDFSLKKLAKILVSDYFQIAIIAYILYKNCKFSLLQFMKT
jgi:hypothetical protein